MEPTPETGLRHRLRTMDKRLRLLLVATALLIIPGIGQFLALHDIATAGRLGDLAFFFMFAAIFIIPTSVILTGVILFVVRHDLRRHERLVILGLLNLLLALNLVWFFLHACSWAQVFGVALQSCRR